MVRNWDAIVIGGGPAGSTAARTLSAKGLKVILLERHAYPRSKACGGGLVRRSVSQLPLDAATLGGVSCPTAVLKDAENSLHFRLSRDNPLVVVVTREVLDAALAREAISKGVELREGSSVIGMERTDTEWVVRTSDGYAVRAKYIVAADGSNSTVARLMEWPHPRRAPAIECDMPREFLSRHEAGTVVFDFLRRGYGWVFPKSDTVVNLGIISMVKGSVHLRATFDQYLKSYGIARRSTMKTIGYTVPIRPRRGRLAQRGVFLTGDAAGLADPLTAEGISAAMISGRLAGEAIVGALMFSRENSSAERTYEKLLSEIVRDLRFGRVFAGAFYDIGWVRRRILRSTSSAVPSLQRVFDGSTNYMQEVKRLMRLRSER